MPPIDPDAVAALVERATRAHEQEQLPACQLALLHRGETVVTETIGAAPDARFVGFSTAKGVSSGVIVHLLSEGDLRLEDRAAAWIPEFDRDGFDQVTVEHLLTHRAGFPNAPMRTLEAATREARGARYASWYLESTPGQQYRYHPTAAHWVLADIATAITGEDFGELARKRILDPLGLEDMALGVPVERQDGIRRVCMVGDDVEPGLAIGDLFPEAQPEILMQYSDPQVLAIGAPGAGLVTTAEALAEYMSAWLTDDAGPWSAQWVADTTRNIRVPDIDPTTNVAANRTLAFVVAGDDGAQALRELGPAVGPRAFGCSGLGGQVAWADPDSGLAWCFLTSGINHDVVASWRRGFELNELAARCAG